MTLPVWPEGVRCGTCRHWDADGWTDGGFKIGICEPITWNTAPGEEKAMIDSIDDGEFVTAEDFGCVLWEARS